MARARREDGYYPTDPHASAALHAWLAVSMPRVLRDTWIDPAAGDGLLLDGLMIPRPLRHAIELHAYHRDELVRRVPASQVVIGDALATPWNAVHVVMNPDFDHATMTRFVSRALQRQAVRGGLVVCLALATWWHSDALRARGGVLRRPSYVLVPDRRVSCDGTGRGDMRAIDWIVWTPPQSRSRTEVVWLPPAAPDAALLAEHKRLASLGA